MSSARPYLNRRRAAYQPEQTSNGRLDILDRMVREARDEVVLYHPLPLGLLELIVYLQLQLCDRLSCARRPRLLRGSSSRGRLCHGEGALWGNRRDRGYAVRVERSTLRDSTRAFEVNYA